MYGAARQMGFLDADECPQLCKLAYDYLRKSKGCEDSILEFFANEPDSGRSLCLRLIDEFDKCILSYFAFHWGQASDLISQVLLLRSSELNKTQFSSDQIKHNSKFRFSSSPYVRQHFFSFWFILRLFQLVSLFILYPFEWQVLSFESEKKTKLQDFLLAATR